MKKFKRLVSLVITFIMLFSSISIVSEAEEYVDWSDVTRYYPFSSWAVNTGIKYKLIFLENNRRETKRYEVANILFNIASLTEEKEATKRFNDISDISETLQRRISKVADEGMLRGYEDGSFKPLNNVTRAEFVTMLNNSGVLKKSGSNKVNFADVQGHWAEKSINTVASLGIVTGKGENNFCPEDSITPQEIFIILDRLVEQNSISKEKLIFTITDTFQSKVYGDKEQYIIEVMYSKFDQVQNDIKHTWSYEKYYDPEKWQEMATYSDLVNALFFTESRKKNINIEENGVKVIDKIKKIVFEFQGITDNLDAHLADGINFRNLIYSLEAEKYRNTTKEYEEIEERIYYVDDDGSYKIADIDELENKLKFSNSQEFSSYEKAMLIKAIFRSGLRSGCYENNTMYFPMNAPVTKYMLNYTILRLQKRYKTYEQTVAAEDIAALFGGTGDDFETDESKLPYNYQDFPFIVKGIPKEVYERPFKIVDPSLKMATPRECYTKYQPIEESTRYKTDAYLDLILNVDYRTIDVQEFSNQASILGYPSPEFSKKYAQYVIDNKIILKGKGYVIPGTMHIVEPFCNARVVIQFEVISADKRIDLLYGDMSYSSQDGQKLDVEYTKDKYTICYDATMGGVFDWQTFIIQEYRIYGLPIISEYYYKGEGITEMP